MKREDLIEESLSSKEIFKGVVTHLFVDKVRLSNGKTTTREYIRHNGAVAVVPIDSEGNVYLVEQYRYPLAEVLTEIPAGKLDNPDENPYDAAMRELREETGFVSKKVTYLGEFIGSPAIVGERIWLYLAEELEEGEQDLDSDEFLNVIKMPLETLVEKIMAGEISDGKTAYAALKVNMMKNGK